MSYRIGIIEPNTFSINDYSIQNFNFESLKEQVETYVQFKEIEENDELIKLIIETINLPSNVHGYTTRIYHNEEYVYEMCHLIHDKIFNRDDSNNNLATLLIKTDKISGFAVIVKTKIISNGKYIPDKLELNELVNIVRTKIVHKGVVVGKNVSEYEFIFSPIEMLSESEVKNLRTVEIFYLNCIICLFIEVEPSINEINKKITMITTDKIIKGRVFMVLKNKDKTEYYNLDKKLFNKIIAIMSDNSYNSNVMNEEIEDDFYYVINERYKKFIERNGEIEYKERIMDGRDNIHELMKNKM